MPINYIKAAEKYRPLKIKILLIAEAPPANGKSYFYVARKLDITKPIRQDASLTATIFNHYFGERPNTAEKYERLLKKLKARGIFLIDIIDKPVQVRIRNKGVDIEAINEIKRGIRNLKSKMKRRGICIPDNNLIFLMPRAHYKKDIKVHFPDSRLYRWIDFRMFDKGRTVKIVKSVKK